MSPRVKMFLIETQISPKWRPQLWRHNWVNLFPTIQLCWYPFYKLRYATWQTHRLSLWLSPLEKTNNLIPTLLYFTLICMLPPVPLSPTLSSPKKPKAFSYCLLLFNQGPKEKRKGLDLLMNLKDLLLLYCSIEPPQRAGNDPPASSWKRTPLSPAS